MTPGNRYKDTRCQIQQEYNSWEIRNAIALYVIETKSLPLPRRLFLFAKKGDETGERNNHAREAGIRSKTR